MLGSIPRSPTSFLNDLMISMAKRPAPDAFRELSFSGHHPDRKNACHVRLFNPSTGFDGLGLSAPVSLRDALAFSRDTRRYARGNEALGGQRGMTSTQCRSSFTATTPCSRSCDPLQKRHSAPAWEAERGLDGGVRQPMRPHATRVNVHFVDISDLTSSHIQRPTRTHTQNIPMPPARMLPAQSNILVLPIKNRTGRTTATSTI